MMIYYIELGKTVMDNIFKGLIDTELTQVIEVSDFLICVGTALAIGVILALINTFRNRCTKSFIVSIGGSGGNIGGPQGGADRPGDPGGKPQKW